jgi:hypothetical protein
MKKNKTIKHKLKLHQSRKRKKGKRHTRRTYGGAGPGQPGVFTVLFTMLGYGLMSLLMGPLYVVTHVLNAPINNINYLTGRAFDHHKYSFLHMPIYKVFLGHKNHSLSSDKFQLQEDMYLDKDNPFSIVSCEKDVKGETQKREPSFSDSIKDMFDLIDDNRKLQFHVFKLFKYIDSLKETDDSRQEEIKEMVKFIPDYKALIKCYLIYKTLTCKKPLPTEKTIIVDEDIVNVINPLYYPPSVDGYEKKIRCMWKHLTKKRFKPEDKVLCDAPCETCTFHNSFRRIIGKYTSLFSNAPSSSIESIINTYYKFMDVKKGPFPNIILSDSTPTNYESHVMKPFMSYLNSVVLTPKAKITEQETIVLDMFQRLMCRYDIIKTVTDEIHVRVKTEIMNGKTLHQIIGFI